MPRQPRAASGGPVCHVWARGIEKRALFYDERDRRDLRSRLSDLLPARGVPCLAWVFMDNHLHLVLRCRDAPLSSVMQRLLCGYAVAFNLRHDRAGHLFQNRFGSRAIASESDLLGVIRYVLRNPLEAGIATDLAALERYEWSALGALVGLRDPLPFEAVDETLDLVAGDVAEARDRLRALLTLALDDREDARPPGFDDLVREVCAGLGASEADLRAGRRTALVSRARDRICRRAVAELGLRPVDVARALGIVRSAVSGALRRESARREPSS